MSGQRLTEHSRSGPSKADYQPLKVEPGRSLNGYGIEHNSTGTESGGVSPVSTRGSAAGWPLSDSPTKFRDFAPAQRVRSNESLDPRSHWSASNSRSSQRYVEVPDRTTSSGKTESRERPDSGIHIPDRTTSQGKALLDESVLRSDGQYGNQANQQGTRNVQGSGYSGTRGAPDFQSSRAPRPYQDDVQTSTSMTTTTRTVIDGRNNPTTTTTNY